MVNNKDYQFRLHKKNVRWINKVHEIPEPVKDKKAVVIDNYHIKHNKTLDRQNEQNDKYDNILDKKESIFNKIIYDSVLFTNEGISKHAVEEIRELENRNYTINFINDEPKNRNEEKGFLFAPRGNIDRDNDEYITILNQPPTRWERSYHLKNLIGYLAFEGVLIKQWIDIINKSPILELWTPSNYCKEQFIKDGITKPIYVIPHGIDPTIWKPMETKKNDKFTFLWCGTAHNKRKGLDLVVKAFSETFEGNNNVQLLIKCNKIYNKNQDVNKLIFKQINGNNNIKFCDDDITEKEFVQLINEVDCVVLPARCEGFGIINLQALACGTPLITTLNGGLKDFCNEDNSLIVNNDGEKFAPWDYPYYLTKWKEPSLKIIKTKMKYVYDNYKNIKELTIMESEKIRNNWTWGKTVDKIEERIKKIKI